MTACAHDLVADARLAVVFSNGLRSLWKEPRPARSSTTTTWLDRAPVALLVPAVIIEGALRAEVVWRPFALVLGVALALLLAWRRVHPFGVFLTAFGAVLFVDVVALLVDVAWVGLDSYVMLLLLPYSLFRWGEGREAAIGLGIMLVAYSLSLAGGEMKNLTEAVGAAVFFLFPAVLGASVRFRANNQLRELEHIKLREREMLARELHDTVAHHVSAIAIQAQAGRAVAALRPEAAVAALAVIEKEAARTLIELRLLVGALRDHQAAELAPQAGVADIAGLARSAGDKHPVELRLSGDLDDLRPSLDAAIYRLAQESITNAIRHARNASHILVRVDGDDDVVRLTVTDDGDLSAGRSSSGFGLVGMAERAQLLGGSFEAGPRAEGGWQVDAVLPRSGAPR